MLIPRPFEPLTEFNITRDSYGASMAKMTATYTLNFRLLYLPLGAGRSNYIEPMPGLIRMIAEVWDALLAVSILDGAVDIVPWGISLVGPTEDPTGNPYWGADFSFHITEFVN
jgi:hypothetical protein